MAEEKKGSLYGINCPQDCSACASPCDINQGESGPSFFDRLESVSEHVEAMGEDNFINMLNEAVAELEAQEAAEESAEEAAEEESRADSEE